MMCAGLLLGMLLALPGQLAAASPRVVTTVAPVTSIVENVAGDRARVTGIVPEGVNSHTFRPVPSDARTMARADLIIMNGLYLEIPTLKLAEANKRPDTPILLLADRTLGEADYVFDFSYPKDQGHPNPHLWPDPVLVMNYARLVRDALTAADPAGRPAYHANAALYLKQLAALDKAIAAAVATVPPANRRLLNAGLPSVRVEPVHRLRKAGEKEIGVVGAGAGLRMILHTENGPVGEPHPLQRAVIQIEMRDLHVGGQRLLVDRVVVVLRRDLDVRTVHVADRLVAAMMAELQLERLRPQRQADDLMPQTDAEHRPAALQ